jgi:hypothetical protein
MSDELRPEVTVGAPGGDHITIRVLGRLYPGADDFGDGNWLSTLIDFAAGQFSGTVSASLRAEELQAFRDGLEKLYATLQGEALLESMEEWLTLRVTATSSGRLYVTGRLTDRPGDGNQLLFDIDSLDQSYLPAILENLDEVRTFFPVLGTP